jgi:hypothetical protein
MFPILVRLSLAGVLALPGIAMSATLAIPAARDAVLYEDPAGATGNGAGESLVAGRTNQASNSRTGASLQLHALAVSNAGEALSLHRVLTNWTSGASNPSGTETTGSAALAGDSTWLHSSFNTAFWLSPGGDHAVEASAVATAGLGEGFVIWSGAGLQSDVQGWLASPGSNFGWLLRTEETASQTARRFDSSESATPEFRPVLTVEYTVIPEAGATVLGAFGGLLLSRRRRPAVPY